MSEWSGGCYQELIVDEEELMTRWESRVRATVGQVVGWSKLGGTWYKERVLMVGPSLV